MFQSFIMFILLFLMGAIGWLPSNFDTAHFAPARAIVGAALGGCFVTVGLGMLIVGLAVREWVCSLKRKETRGEQA